RYLGAPLRMAASRRVKISRYNCQIRGKSDAQTSNGLFSRGHRGSYRGAFGWRAKPMVLLEDIVIGHSRQVVTDHTIDRLAAELLLVGHWQLFRESQEVFEELGDYVLRLLLFRFQLRA